MKTKGIPESKTWRRIKRLGFAALALMITGVVLLACIFTAPPGGDVFGTTELDVDGQEAREALEKLWGAPLPESAGDFHYYAYGFQDVIGYGRFTLPAEAWEAAIADSTLCVKANLNAKPPVGFGNDQIDKGWWMPDDATQVIGGEQCEGTNGAYYNLLVDTSNESTYIVYVYAFTT